MIARFRDGNPLAAAADHRAAITWGDGTSSTGRVVRVAPGHFAVRATHRYRTAARRRIIVRIQDDRGATLRVRTAPRVRRAQPAPRASSRSGERDDSAARGVLRRHAR